jgi:hypothetical protein
MAVPQLRQSVVGFPQRWPTFDPELDHVGFVAGILALGHVFFEYSGFPC